MQQKLKFLKIHQKFNYCSIFINFFLKCAGDQGLSKMTKKKIPQKILKVSKRGENSKIRVFCPKNLEFWAFFAHFGPTQFFFF